MRIPRRVLVGGGIVGVIILIIVVGVGWAFAEQMDRFMRYHGDPLAGLPRDGLEAVEDTEG